MTDYQQSEMRLYDVHRGRLYINAEERRRFLSVVASQPPQQKAFGLLLTYTGCRVSEGLALRRSDIQVEDKVVMFRTLKRRRIAFREVPVPPDLLLALLASLEGDLANSRNYIFHRDTKMNDRATAFRWIKRVMLEAGISGAQACPKGLRHGFGIHAIRCGIPLNMVQKWMGHASMSTTAIYTNAVGPDEQLIASRMWACERMGIGQASEFPHAHE